MLGGGGQIQGEGKMFPPPCHMTTTSKYKSAYLSPPSNLLYNPKRKIETFHHAQSLPWRMSGCKDNQSLFTMENI